LNAALSGLVGTALGIRTVSSMMQSKLAGQDKAIKKHQSTTTLKRKAAARKFGTRLASRIKRVAAKSIAAIPAESIPFILETAVGREKDVQDIDVHGEFEKRVVTLSYKNQLNVAQRVSKWRNHLNCIENRHAEEKQMGAPSG
jgi:hypothetical protein